MKKIKVARYIGQEECKIYFDPQDDLSDKDIKRILKYKTIAIVGLSTNTEKASNNVARYMIEKGYDIIPINPNHDTILGIPCYNSLKELPRKVDIVNIFRRPNEVGPVVDEAIAVNAKAVWLQLQIVNFEAYKKARSAGLDVVMNRCIKVEHSRLFD
ncbi:MAG: CoA-binding protein [Candidatus Methanofastidiosia archaeon]